MAGGSADTDLTNQLNTLFRVGVIGDLSDGQLLQRYLTAPDGAFQAAFTALVGRHGPMVLRVCRQVLGDSHDAQDAFQATFLVLIRKAGSVRKVDSLASWLHRVAFRCAVRTRADASRRRVHEHRGVAMRATGAECEGVRAESWSELHEEVARLPERYREPVVLCYLEGLTTEAAALRLGCPRGTVLSRLSRARERLRARLARRGLDSVPAMVQIIVDAPAPVPDSLAVATTALAALDAVRLSAGGPPVAGIALTSVLTVSAGVLNTMTIAKLKTAAVALSTAVLLGMAGAGVYAFQGRDQATRPEPKPAKAGPPAPETNPGPATDPARRRPDSLVAEGATAEPARAVDLVSTPELAAQLEVARKRLAHIKPLFERRSISTSVLDEAEGHVQILEGRVAGRAQQLEEERELLKIRLEGKRAEQEGAQAEVDVAKAGLAALRRPNEGRVMVTQEDLAKAEAGLRRAEADRAGRVAQVREIQVRIMQVERRLRALAPLLKDAKPAPAPAPALPGAPGAYKESGTNGSRIT